MRRQVLEARVLQVVEDIVDGRRVEDDRIELKAEWPQDHRKAARQIGGLANSGAGEPVLWIIGVDEDSARLVDPGHEEPAEWWAKVQRCFSELAPSVEMLSVRTPLGLVVALEFDTSRAPYLVTTTGVGGIDIEIPWRESNKTRSAKRSEILRSLVGEVAVPQLELVSAGLICEWVDPSTMGGYMRLSGAHIEADVELQVYVEASEPARLPEHKWSLELDFGDGVVIGSTWLQIIGPRVPLSDGGSRSWGRQRPRQHAPFGSISYVTNSGLHVNGSDRIEVEAHVDAIDPDHALADRIKRCQRVRIRLAMPLSASARQASLEATLRRVRQVPLRSDEAAKNLDSRVGTFTRGAARLPHKEPAVEKEPVSGTARPVRMSDPHASRALMSESV